MRVGLNNIYKVATQTSVQGAKNFKLARDIPEDMPREHMNLYQAVNSAIDVALATDPT